MPPLRELDKEKFRIMRLSPRQRTTQPNGRMGKVRVIPQKNAESPKSLKKKRQGFLWSMAGNKRGGLEELLARKVGQLRGQGRITRNSRSASHEGAGVLFFRQPESETSKRGKRSPKKVYTWLAGRGGKTSRKKRNGLLVVPFFLMKGWKSDIKRQTVIFPRRKRRKSIYRKKKEPPATPVENTDPTDGCLAVGSSCRGLRQGELEGGRKTLERKRDCSHARPRQKHPK